MNDGLTTLKWIIIFVLLFFFFVVYLIRLLVAFAFIALILTLTIVFTLTILLLLLIWQFPLFVCASHVALLLLARSQYLLATFLFDCSIRVLLVLDTATKHVMASNHSFDGLLSLFPAFLADQLFICG